MTNPDGVYDEVISELLKDFSLEEILEINNLTEEEILYLLFQAGLVSQPESILRQFESSDYFNFHEEGDYDEYFS